MQKAVGVFLSLGGTGTARGVGVVKRHWGDTETSCLDLPLCALWGSRGPCPCSFGVMFVEPRKEGRTCQPGWGGPCGRRELG